MSLKPSDCADYEPEWKKTSYGMFNSDKTIFLNSKLMNCCEKCVFNSGVHASYCSLYNERGEASGSRNEAINKRAS